MAAVSVFVLFFAVYSYRLGIAPVLMHDDFEYTYPSFDLAEHGNYGTPLLGPGFNIEKRNYSLTIYYYAAVHAALILLFGDGATSVPLANTFHFALLAAAVTCFLARRRAWLGILVFLCCLVCDPRVVEAARHGRPEMTAGFCLTMAVLGLWLWLGEARRSAPLLFGVSAALAAGVFSHTSIVFFAAATLGVLGIPLLRRLRWRDAAAAAIPPAFVVSLYVYFVATDSWANIQGQMAPGAGDVMLRVLLRLAVSGDWGALEEVARDFIRGHLSNPGVWLGTAACLAAPRLVPHAHARAARFMGGLYLLFVGVNFACLKHFVLSYRAIYEATLYLGLAFLAEATIVRVSSRREARLGRSLRAAGIVTLATLATVTMVRFRQDLQGQRPPFARLKGALTYALLRAGAEPGDRVFVPSPFGFQLKDSFDVMAHPAPKYYRGRWSPAFRDGLRAIWGAETLAQYDQTSLCFAMGIAYVRPSWIMAWNADYGYLQSWWDFLRRFRGYPGVEIREAARSPVPEPYGGTVRVYRVDLSEPVRALDRSVNSTTAPCP